MVQSISGLQNYNLYVKNSPLKTHCEVVHHTKSAVSFKGITSSIKKPSVVTSVSSFITDLWALAKKGKKRFNTVEYLDKISYIPKEIFINEQLCKNPELIPFAEKLDTLTPKQKKKFVKAFCQKTGFPDLTKVQKIMDNEIRKTLDTTLKDTNTNALFAGYASSCSVGRATALPGSDCDGLFFVVDKIDDWSKINRATLGEGINQRILDTRGTHYPELFLISELMPYIDSSNKLFKKIKAPQKIKSYEQNLLRSDQDFLKAGEFNLDLASQLTKDYDKNMMYLTAMFVEEIRAGHIVVNNLNEGTINTIKNSALYKYSNVVRQEGFKNNIKPKWTNRIKMASEFNSKSDEEKFQICSDILKSSMGITKPDLNGSYEEFDMGNILELIDKLTTFRQFLKK